MINRATLVGKVGNDMQYYPEKPGKPAMVKFDVCTWRQYKTREGKWDYKNTWHKCTAFGPQADYIGKWILENERVYIEGEIRYKQLVPKEGYRYREEDESSHLPRIFTEIVVEAIRRLAPPNMREEGLLVDAVLDREVEQRVAERAHGVAGERGPAPTATPVAEPQAAAPTEPIGVPEFDADDIPF
jgi:single stranded DNA-binding protein